MNKKDFSHKDSSFLKKLNYFKNHCQDYSLFEQSYNNMCLFLLLLGNPCEKFPTCISTTNKDYNFLILSWKNKSNLIREFVFHEDTIEYYIEGNDSTDREEAFIHIDNIKTLIDKLKEIKQ